VTGLVVKLETFGEVGVPEIHRLAGSTYQLNNKLKIQFRHGPMTLIYTVPLE
jgi:hypothetical protein